jgi:hypothetical protein
MKHDRQQTAPTTTTRPQANQAAERAVREMRRMAKNKEGFQKTFSGTAQVLIDWLIRFESRLELGY